MKVKIFNCHHVVPERRIMTEMFATLVSGAHGDPLGGYLGDLDGINIAPDNIYTEIRHFYYVWKNLLADYDYVGFEHYRRLLFLDPLPQPQASEFFDELVIFRQHFQQDSNLVSIDASNEAFAAYWKLRQDLDRHSTDRLKQWIGRHDAIVPRPLYTDGIEKQWYSCLPAHDWNVLIDAANRSRLARRSRSLSEMNILTGSYNNIFIMRSETFDEYMDFCFDCLEYIAPRVERRPRHWGNFTERLLNVFLYIKKVADPIFHIYSLPYLFWANAYVPALPNAIEMASLPAEAVTPPVDDPQPAAKPVPVPQGGIAKDLSDTLLGRDPWYGFVPRRGVLGPIEGWNGRHPLFDRLVETMSGSVVIDVGVWKGQATQYLAELIKRRGIKGCVIAIDTFLGSFEHITESRKSFGLVDGRPDLMETFLNNIHKSGLQDFVLPLAQTNPIAARLLGLHGVQADLIHLDAALSFEDLLADAKAFWPLVAAGGTLVGDDYVDHWPEVQRAANRFADSVGLPLETDWPKWFIRKPG